MFLIYGNINKKKARPIGQGKYFESSK